MADTKYITLENLSTFKTQADKAYAGSDTVLFTGTTTSAVGGIAKGTTFSASAISDVLEALLVPYVATTVTAFSTNPSFGVKEKGTTVTLSTATVTIAKGSKDISGHTITVTGSGNTYGSVAAGSVRDGANTVTLSGSITADQTLTATVNDGQNNATKTGSYTFVDPYYYGVVSDISVITGGAWTGLTKNVESKGPKTREVSPTAQYIVFAYPASYGNLSSIKDGNGFENIGGFTLLTQNMTVTSGSVSYNIYYTSDVKTASNFSLTFAYQLRRKINNGN